MTELTHSTNEDKANKLHPFNKRFELNSPQLETDILSLITPLGLGVEESTISSKIKVLLGSGESIDFFYFPLKIKSSGDIYITATSLLTRIFLNTNSIGQHLLFSFYTPLNSWLFLSSHRRPPLTLKKYFAVFLLPSA